MAGSALAYWILARLHYVHATGQESEASAADIAAWLTHRWQIRASYDEVYELLRQLEHLGIVLSLQDPASVKTMHIKWAVRAGLPPDWETVWRDGGNGGDGDNGNGQMPSPAPDGDDPGGNGLREVLAHPVLFSLPEHQLKALIDHAFDLGSGTDPSGQVGS